MIPLTAQLNGLGAVVVGFGDAVVAAIPMTEDETYRVTHTGETEEEVAAEIAARWLRERLGVTP